MADFREFPVVGVARIELATPAMSTQCLWRESAENRPSSNIGTAEKREQTGNRREFHRSDTGVDFTIIAGPGWDCPKLPEVMTGWFAGPAPEIVRGWVDIDAKNQDAHVYFVQRSTDRAIKIGYTAHISTRMKSLEREFECDIEILATTPGARCLENVYHAAFQDHNIHGEWFTRHPDILAEIDRLNSTPSISRGGDHD